MCTKCCAYEGASPFVRKCGSVAGARRGGGAKGREVYPRGEFMVLFIDYIFSGK